MRIVYMGTPDFAVPALASLHEAGHEIVYVVTRPDARSNRGKKIHYSPVKEKALELGLDVLQPTKIRGNEEILQTLADAKPDVIVVAAYGRILPPEILELPAKGCLNIHGSLLPRFRGAAPIQAAVLEGDEVTGITIMQMEEGLDTGGMLLKGSTPVNGKNAGQLHDELSRMGADLICSALDRLDEITAEVQDDSLATYAPMISKKDGLVDFTNTPERIERQMRAFDPWPGTYTWLGDQMMKFWSGCALADETDAAPGTVVAAGPEGIDIAAGGRILRVTELQMPGRKRTAASEYLKGNSIEIGTVLG